MRKRHWSDRKNRKCPDCSKMIYYTRKDSFDRAVGNNSVCKSCAQMDRKLTLETIQKMKQPALLIASERANVARFGTLKIENGYVKSFRQATGLDEAGIVNGGAYIMESALFLDRKVKAFSLEHELFPELVIKNQLISYLVEKKEGFFDIGVPESYKYICSKGGMQ